MIYVIIAIYLVMMFLGVSVCAIGGLMERRRWMYDPVTPEEQLRAMGHWRIVKTQSSDVRRGK